MTNATVCDSCGRVVKETDRSPTYSVHLNDPQGSFADADFCPDCIPEKIIEKL